MFEAMDPPWISKASTIGTFFVGIILDVQFLNKLIEMLKDYPIHIRTVFKYLHWRLRQFASDDWKICEDICETSPKYLRDSKGYPDIESFLVHMLSAFDTRTFSKFLEKIAESSDEYLNLHDDYERWTSVGVKQVLHSLPLAMKRLEKALEKPIQKDLGDNIDRIDLVKQRDRARQSANEATEIASAYRQSLYDRRILPVWHCPSDIKISENDLLILRKWILRMERYWRARRMRWTKCMDQSYLQCLKDCIEAETLSLVAEKARAEAKAISRFCMEVFKVPIHPWRKIESLGSRKNPLPPSRGSIKLAHDNMQVNLEKMLYQIRHTMMFDDCLHRDWEWAVEAAKKRQQENLRQMICQFGQTARVYFEAVGEGFTPTYALKQIPQFRNVDCSNLISRMNSFLCWEFL